MMSLIKLTMGFLIGVYVGTYFDCKPHLKKIEKIIHENFPKKR
jgi:hypothetical protein